MTGRSEPFGTMFESANFGRDASPPLLAAAASMRVIRDYQLLNKSRHDITIIKEDDTYQTAVDRESAQAAINLLRGLPSYYEIKAEDGTTPENPSATNIILMDNLDGTNAFVLDLPTSTVIIADYDKQKRRIASCLIAEPVRGRIWLATGKQVTIMTQFKEDRSGTTLPKVVKVWKGLLSRKTSTIFLDISHGFTRKERQLMTDEDVARLFGNLNTKAKILLPGSNGLMHALVASGGEGLAGGITTAMGGEWDVAGIFLVLRAGGFARAFRINENRMLTEADPLDPFAYDTVAFGNSRETVDILVDAIKASIV